VNLLPVPEFPVGLKPPQDKSVGLLLHAVLEFKRLSFAEVILIP